jgi:DNA-binding MarR family transcriptional regulator
VKEVRLTTAGRERIARVLEQLPAQHELVLGELNPPERDQLQRLLDKMARRLATLARDSDNGLLEGEENEPS